MKGLITNNYNIVIEPLGDKDVFKAMDAGKDILESIGCTYWFSAGTCLGLVREDKGWIEHDTDIDVEVLVSNDEANNLKDLFIGEDYRLIREMSYQGRLMQLAFIDKENIIFDIYFYYDIEDDEYVNHNDMGILRFSKSFTIKEIRGYNCPDPVEHYLELRYGLGWVKPNSSKSGWGNDAGVMLERVR